MHKYLEAATNRSADISSSIDRAALTKSLGIAAAGVKLIDVSCVELETGDFCNIPALKKCFVQSCKRCFPLEIILAKNTSKTYENFTDFFQFIEDVATDISEEHSVRAINKMHPDSHQFNLLSAGDILGHNKVLKREGVLQHRVFLHSLRRDKR